MNSDIAMSDNSAGDRKSDDGQPAQKRPRLSSPSPPSVNSLLLDHPFLNTFISNVTDTSAPLILSTVFSTVFDNPAWSGKLKEEFKDLAYCKAAIKKDTSLLDCMKECAEKANWDPLFAHRALSKRRESGEHLQPHIIKAFESIYLGNAHKTMLRAIDEIKDRTQYACLLPVVQSSGMGKSRTIHRIAQDRIVIPMCLREKGAKGFPYPDTNVQIFLSAAPSASAEIDCKRYLGVFLLLLLEKTLEQLEMFRDQGKTSYVEITGEFFRFFNDGDQREAFYKGVLSSSLALLSDPQPPSSQENSSISDAILQAWTNLEKSLNKCKPSSKGRRSLPKGYPVIIALDEVHVLHDKRDIDDGLHSLYSRFKSVLSDQAECNFCTVVLSTAMSISDLAPAKAVAPSARENTHKDLPIAPYTELPFDVHIIEDPLRSGQLGLESVGSLEFTAKFGRPLWYSMYTSRLKNTLIAKNIIKFVQVKLSGLQYPFERFDKIEASSLAILSTRLLLDMSPITAQARKYEQELVRSHLRVVYSVHANREVFFTGSSPEPLVAEAAAQIMNARYPMSDSDGKMGSDGMEDFDDKQDSNGVKDSDDMEDFDDKQDSDDKKDLPLMNVWKLVKDFANTGLADQGAIGELVGRTLSILAMDSAINGLKQHCELKYQTPVPVNTYYKALLTDDVWDVLRTSVPANGMNLTVDSATKTFEEAFKDAYFHFSHYAKAGDDSPLRSNFAWAHWLRGTAISCQLNQELTDRALPMFFSNCGTVSPDSISWTLDQDKTSLTADPVKVPIQSAERLGLFSGATKLPYIAVVHCYALERNQRIIVTRSPCLPDLHDLCNLRDTNEKAPRYQIDIRGLEPYRNVSDTLGNEIRGMMNGSKSFIFDKHPRKAGVPFLHQLQPLLTEKVPNNLWHT